MTDIIVGLGIGTVGGFVGGMLGVGGGVFYIPAMVIILGTDQHMAQGASLAAIVATAIVGGYAHLRQGNVDVPTVAWVAPAAVVTGFGAALLADQLDGEVLQRIFAVVMSYLAVTMIVGALRTGSVAAEEREST